MSKKIIRKYPHKRTWIDLRVKDRRWITNGIENKFLYKEELQKYLDNGWKLGAKQKRHVYNEQTK